MFMHIRLICAPITFTYLLTYLLSSLIDCYETLTSNCRLISRRPKAKPAIFILGVAVWKRAL